MGKLDGKVALVSGSGRGIGRSIALKLASEGARIVVNDLDSGPADDVAEEIGQGGGKAIAVTGSVTEQGFAERFVSAAVDSFGGLDIIVNNAGYTWDATIQKTTDEQFEAMLEVHLLAPFRILRTAAEPIRAMSRKEPQESPHFRCLRSSPDSSMLRRSFGSCRNGAWAWAKRGSWVVGLRRFGGSSLGCMGMTCTPSALMRWQVPRWG